MALSGLMLIGTLEGVEQVRYGASHEKAGEPVPGFYKATVAIGEAWDGSPMLRQVSFNATDRETGEATRFAAAIEKIADGTRVAIAVSTRLPRPGGKYVELDPRYVEVLDESVVIVDPATPDGAYTTAPTSSAA